MMTRLKLLIQIILFFLLLSRSFAFCTVDKISNVHFGPDLKYRIKWPLYKYTPLRKLKKHNIWYKVMEFNGEIGWIQKKHVNNDHLCAIVKVNHTTLRKHPSKRKRKKNNTPEPKALYSDTFKVLEITKSRKWARVENEKGQQYWIERKMVWIY